MTKIALFIGAGFSKWSVNLPVANQLFDFNIKSFGPREDKKLHFVREVKEHWDISNPNAHSEQFILYALHSSQKIKKSVIWYITRRLTKPFIWTDYYYYGKRRHVLMIDESRKTSILGFDKAKFFIHQFCGPFLSGYFPEVSGIITTNYDLLIEYTLGTKGFNYGVKNQRLIGRGPYPLSQWLNPIQLTGNITLAKIHGSVSWDEHGFYTDGRRGITGNSLIVAPTPEKQPPEALNWVWELAERILSKTTKLIIFGFAFNPYDEAVLKLLEKNGRHIKSVLIVDIESKVNLAKSIWPDSKITCCPPPPDGSTLIAEWKKHFYPALIKE